MKKVLLTITVLLLFIGSESILAQNKPLTIDDYPQWSRIVGTELSADGNWMAYALRPNGGDDTLFVRALNSDKLYEIPNANGAEFSKDGKWVSYLITPDKEARKKLTKAKKPVHKTAELMNLQTGEKTAVERADKQSFSNNSELWVVHRKKPEEDESKHKGSDLVVRNLKNTSVTSIGNVSEFGMNKKSTMLAYIVDANDKVGNGIYTYNLSTNATQPLHTDTTMYEGLVWDDARSTKTEWTKKGNSLAVLKGNKPEKAERKENSLLVISNVGKTASVIEVKPTAVPDDLIISENRTISWTDNGNRVLIGLREQEETIKLSKDSVANVDVWHWKDPRIQTVQMRQYNRDSRFTYVASYNIRSKKLTRLTDDEMRNLNVNTNSSYMVGEDEKPYINDVNWGVNPTDLYHVNLENGKRTLFAKEINRKLGYSPDGRYYLYQKVEDDLASMLVYDLQNNKVTDLTKNSPVRFSDEEHIYPHENPPFGVAGWTKDGKNVILNHKYDLWMLALDGSKATNITKGEGEKNKIIYRVQRLDNDERFIDTKKPIVLSAFGDLTKKSGFSSLKIGDSPKTLVYDDVRFGRPIKAENADKLIITKETFVEFPNYYSTTTAFKNLKQMTDANPQQADYAWGERKLIEFKNGKGRTVQGTLALPANYQPGKRYPTVIYFYEMMSDRHHQYSMPTYDDRPHMSAYASNGYMVFMPDVYLEEGYAGTTSLDGITSAANALIDQGYSDPDNIGLQGHSWGGYQTSFILTQTNMFKTIVIGAPPTNLESFYNNIYGSTGTNHHGIMEIGQVRMGRGVTPWSAPETYRRENPMAHVPNIETPFLILHGTEDGAVDWSQGLELYNAARRLGKEVIFLSYPGEGHHLANEANQIDFQIRMKEYFDHHLKGIEAPDWMINGVPQLEKQYRKAK
ncbi:MAG: prolyl oligopeptidase family serine peptidase [Balneolaceae bacterium]